jgi:hypothetical protein
MSSPRYPGRHRTPRRVAKPVTVLTGAAVAGLVMASLSGVGAPASALLVSATPGQIAAAITTASVTGNGADYVNRQDGLANGISSTPMAGFPTAGSTFGVLTTGYAEFADDTNGNVPDQPGGGDDKSGDLGGGPTRGTSSYDVSVVAVDFGVSATANCLSFDFAFLSEEFPELQDGPFHDGFVAELDQTSWMTTGTNTVNAPDNFAFDGAHDVISSRSQGLASLSADAASGTTYDGATRVLTASTPVTPGLHTLYLSIFDQGDHLVDSAAFVDNLRLGRVADPTTQCRQGVHAEGFGVTLTPPKATHDLGDTHTAEATVTDLATGNPVPDAPVVFTVSGANTATGNETTGADGAAAFSYEGGAEGSDSVSACYDANTSGGCDAGESSASGAVDWLIPAPRNHAGGPYVGDEGAPVTLDGSATVPTGRAMTHTWSASAQAGTDPGAGCTFSDPHALTPTVTCTDDGSYAVHLVSTAGGPAALDSALVTISNLAPSVSDLGVVPAAPGSGSPVTVSATYSDPGSNDEHTSVVDWGDGTTSPGTTTAAASGGTVSADHVFSGAGSYPVCVTVTDDDGASDTDCRTVDVTAPANPDAFVTGGGQIDVRAGSALATPTASGKAVVALVARYAGRPASPGGVALVMFRAGDVVMRADSIDALTVTGNQASFGGTAVVNGRGGYRFQVSLTDGDVPGGDRVDRIRVRVWSTGSGDVLLDTQRGAATTAAPTSPVQGNLAIHS